MNIVPTPSPEVLVHQLVGAFFLPPVLFFWLFLFGWFARRRGRAALGRLLMLGGVLLLYLFSTPQMALWLNTPLEPARPISADELRNIDAIVVLGGGKRPAPEFRGETLTLDSLSRLRYGAWLARASGKPLLVTGGAPLGGEPEAEIMRRMLSSDYGLVPKWVEPASNTTLENAKLSAPLLHAAGVHSIALVSQAWHLRRAAGFFREQGFAVYAAPTGFIRYDGPRWAWWLPQGRAMQECHGALREDVGLLFYAARSALRRVRE
jgi:uncharacterized SAM-binding protein YcdF (DUF218 family)